jgi:hypothetical protein
MRGIVHKKMRAAMYEGQRPVRGIVTGPTLRDLRPLGNQPKGAR